MYKKKKEKEREKMKKMKSFDSERHTASSEIT